MVPNFALSLTFDGIALLRRAVTGWMRLDEVALDDPELDASLRALHERALALSPEAAQVMLILPNEQIRYLDLPDPGGDDHDRAAAVMAALDGATPYAVNELAFDWSHGDGRLQAAAVAHETLDEAESFICAHGFEPVSFTAIPPEGAFAGAPFFGAAPRWDGPAPDRLSQPIRIVPSVPDAPWLHAQSAAAKPAPAPAADKADPAVEGTAPSPLPPAPSETAPVDLSPALEQEPESEAAAETVKLADTGLESAAEPAAADVSPLPPAQKKAPGKAASARKAEPAPETARTKSKPKTSAPEAAPEAPEAKSVRFTAGMFGPGGNARADTIPAPAGDMPVVRPVRDAGGPSSAPSLPGADGTTPTRTPRFTSIRATRDVPAPKPRPRREPVKAGDGTPQLRFTPQPAEAGTEASVTAPALDPAVPAGPAKKKAKSTRESVTSRAFGMLSRGRAGIDDKPAPKDPEPRAEPVAHTAPAPAPVAPAEAAAAKRTGKRKLPSRNALQIAAMRRRPTSETAAAAAASAAAALDAEEERRRMTVFGARGNDMVGGKPRFLGLMLTAVLLLLLAGVAAWASVFLDDGLARFFGPRDPVEDAVVATLPEEAAQPSQTGEAAIPSDAPADEAGDELAALGPVVISGDNPVSEPETELAPPSLPEALTPEEAAAKYAATGIWQRAPTAPLEPQPGSVDDLYIVSVDPAVGQFDAIALPPSANDHDDLTLEPVALPPGPDVRFDLDENGLVRATPEGALSPDGIRVFAGLPPQVPPERRSATTPNAGAEAAPDSPQQPSEETGQNTPQATETVPAQQPDEQLRDLRPRARPGDLIENTERANLGGISFAELSRIRPALRPQSAQEQAAEAQQAEIAAAQEADADTPQQEISASALAVGNSLAPRTRPSNIDAIVRSAEPEPVQVASAAPIRIQPGPKIPQNTNVAREATVRNQLNLRQMNLIGVYGKPSSRRALIRLPNGRYENVKVGDRIDGGRVAAIGETELQLNKGGRNIVLRMPSG